MRLRSGLGVGAATAMAGACNYITNIALGRSLGPEAFGDAALVVSSLLLLSAVATGIQLGIARLIVTGGTDRLRSLQRIIVSASAIVGGLLMLCSAPMAKVFNLASAVPLVVLGAGLPAYAALSVSRGVLQGRGEFGRLAVTLIVEAVGRLAVTVATMLCGVGASAAAVGLSASFALAWWTAHVRTGVAASTMALDGAVRRPTPNASGALGFLLASQVLIANGDVLVVNARLAADAGTYSAVAMIGRLVFVAAAAVVTVVFPGLVGETSAAKRRALLRRAMVMTAGIGCGMTAACAVGARPLLGVLLGSDYASGAHLLWPYALATTFFALANLFAVAEVAAGSSRAPAILLVGGALQTSLLVGVVERGMAWAVWAQVAVMGSTCVVIAVSRVAVGTRVSQRHLAFADA